jgi:hypothetical protein
VTRTWHYVAFILDTALRRLKIRSTWCRLTSQTEHLPCLNLWPVPVEGKLQVLAAAPSVRFCRAGYPASGH